MIVRQFLISREYGGAAHIAARIASTLRARGRRAEMWLPGEGRAADVVRQASIPLRWYDVEAGLASSRYRAARANLALAARLVGGRRSIAHIHAPYLYGAFHRAFRFAGAITVAHLHLDYGVEELRWALRRPPDVVVTCARFLERLVRESLSERWRETLRVEVIPNAVDTERFQPGDKSAARARVGAPPDRPLVLMLANLSPHKGQLTAIRAVAELRRRGTDVCCWLAGADRRPGAPYEKQLTSDIAALGVGDLVRLIGFRADTPELLRAADLLLLPSTSEGLPLTVLEAQAAKVPVLAAPTAGIPEVIRDGETGFLIESGDYARYADAIQRLLADRTMYHRVAEDAYTHCVREHHWDAYYARLLGLYDDLRDRRRENARPTVAASPSMGNGYAVTSERDVGAACGPRPSAGRGGGL